MIAPIVVEVVAILGVIVDFAEDHPELVKMLAERAKTLLDGHEKATLQNPEAVRAMVAGLAAARAEVVQEFARHGKAKW